MALEKSDSAAPPPPSAPPAAQTSSPQATSSRPKLAATQCALEVRIDVAASNWTKFQKLGVEFRPIFAAAGLDLEYAMYGEPYVKNGEVYYVAYNYWRVDNDLNRFVNASLTLPDNPSFGVLDGVLDVEIKNVIIPIGPGRDELPGGPAPRPPITVPHPGIGGDQARYATPTSPPPARLHYIRVVSKLETENAAEYAALVEEWLPTFAQTQGWTLGESFLFLTGADETVVQIWRSTAPPAGVADVLRLLKTSEWHKLTRIDSIELLESTDFDPDMPRQ